MDNREVFKSLEPVMQGSYWGRRIQAQLAFALRLSAARDGAFDPSIAAALAFLTQKVRDDGVLTDAAARAAEGMLSPLTPYAKALTVYCAAHAHMDMNWMWGFQETVALTLDTLRTVLTLMDEYPDFTFSQSQASVYRIVEEYAPELLPAIRARVAEGRWEVTASAWVENDKNMPNGESMARHLLYTRRYLSRLLGLDPASLNLDFEPDTFGHCASLPEILARGGVKYYYHNRGGEGPHLYRWRAPGGAEVLVYRDLEWYNAQIEYDMLSDVPLFCKKYGVDVFLKIYGIGDHGGGPTRRDIERLRDMMTWPCLPTLRFGSYGEFYKALEPFAQRFAVLEGEQNFVFTGCYSAQSRIKMANRVAEDRLYAAEALSGLTAAALGGKTEMDRFFRAWERVLFGQFHDILPGSGVRETREYALGEFSKTLADANAAAGRALRALEARLDTRAIPFDPCPQTVSEGGGAGYQTGEPGGFALPRTERGRGTVRAFLVCNPTARRRREPVELTVWDWEGDRERLRLRAAADHRAVTALCPGKPQRYWGHSYFTLLAEVDIPAFGYAVYVLDDKNPQPPFALSGGDGPRLQDFRDDDLVLENELVRAVFQAGSLRLTSFVDKKSGRELVDEKRGGLALRLIDENPARGMTAWVVGDYMKITDLNETCEVRVTERSANPLRQTLAYSLNFRASEARVRVTLDAHSPTLRFALEVDWRERGTREGRLPQLSFYVPLAYAPRACRCDIPFGTVDRPERRHDIPANSFAAALPPADGLCVLLSADSRCAFRAADASLSATLLRSSCDPDPEPEYGRHHIQLGLSAAQTCENAEFFALRDAFIQPLAYVPATGHGGELPLSASVLAVEGDVRVAAVKSPEDGGRGLILRLYDVSGRGGPVKVRFGVPVRAARLVDLNETPLAPVPLAGDTASFAVPAHGVATLRADMA